MYCHVCGRPGDPAAQVCAGCGATLPPVPSERAGAVEYLDAPTLLADEAPVVHTPTFVERLLGGDWRPALRVILPTVLVAVALAAVTTASQLLTAAPISRFTIIELAPRTTSSYFHGIAREIAAAFGSPVAVGSGLGSVDYRIPPLGVSVTTVVVFALLLRRAVAGVDLLARLITALRCAASVVIVLVVVSLFGTVHGRTYGTPLTTTVSPGKVALWASVSFGVVGLVVALRPLELLERAVPRLRRDDWYPAWVGAVVAVVTAVVLGFVAVVAAGFAQEPGKGDTARLLPRAAGHAVDLGTYGWNASLLGALHGDGRLDSFDDVSLLHRDGVSAWYFVLLVLPVLSITAGALAIRRYAGVADARTLSRCCYRMTLPVTVLFVVLAAASGARSTTHIAGGTLNVSRTAATVSTTGPEVWLGALHVALVYLVLGFLAGQVVRRTAHLRRRVPTAAPMPGAAAQHPTYAPPVAAPEQRTPGIEFVPEHPYGSAPGHGGPPVAQGPRPTRRRPRATTVITLVAAIALVVAAGVAVQEHGGRDAHGSSPADQLQSGGLTVDDGGTGNDTVTLDPNTGEVVDPSDDPTDVDPGFGGSSGDSDSEDSEARATLQELSVAEEDFRSDNGTYIDDAGQLDDYTEPDDVDVELVYADESSFCAVANGYDSDDVYSYDSDDGTVQEGDSC